MTTLHEVAYSHAIAMYTVRVELTADEVARFRADRSALDGLAGQVPQHGRRP